MESAGSGSEVSLWGVYAVELACNSSACKPPCLHSSFQISLQIDFTGDLHLKQHVTRVRCSWRLLLQHIWALFAETAVSPYPQWPSLGTWCSYGSTTVPISRLELDCGGGQLFPKWQWNSQAVLWKLVPLNPHICFSSPQLKIKCQLLLLNF